LTRAHRTTQPKAKALRPEFETDHPRQRGDLHARRQALGAPQTSAVHKLFEEIAPRYAQRPGGYTRIVKLGPRRSDSADMVFLELV
jgi:large subunit ribosomal protein L17